MKQLNDKEQQAIQGISPARLLYIQKQAKKKGVTVLELLNKNKNATSNTLRTYPFTQREDATFRFEHQDALTEEYLKMFNDYEEEYSQTDAGISNIKDWVVGRRLASGHYAVKIGDNTVGMMVVAPYHPYRPLDPQPHIEHCYVKPAYRGWGVAERMYRKAISDLGAVTMSLSYQRCATERQQQYFRNLGFGYCEIMAAYGNDGHKEGIFLLSTQPGEFARELDTINFVKLKAMADQVARLSKKTVRRAIRNHIITHEHLRDKEKLTSDLNQVTVAAAQMLIQAENDKLKKRNNK